VMGSVTRTTSNNNGQNVSTNGNEGCGIVIDSATNFSWTSQSDGSLMNASFVLGNDTRSNAGHGIYSGNNSISLFYNLSEYNTKAGVYIAGDDQTLIGGFTEGNATGIHIDTQADRYTVVPGTLSDGYQNDSGAGNGYVQRGGLMEPPTTGSPTDGSNRAGWFQFRDRSGTVSYVPYYQ